MSFNYGREEKKWRLWKEAEEKQLRSLGVSEDTIEQLHTHDWAVFNSDRRYYRSSIPMIGRSLILTGGITADCRMQVHTLRNLPKKQHSPK